MATGGKRAAGYTMAVVLVLAAHHGTAATKRVGQGWEQERTPLPPPRFGLTIGVQRVASGSHAIWAIATAADPSGNPISLGQAASRMGFDHFNWVQYLVADPDVAACAREGLEALTDADCLGLLTSAGHVPPLPTLDPPLGGWKYQGAAFPTADYRPFYWDEHFPSPGSSAAAGPEYIRYQTTLDRLPSDANQFDRFRTASLADARGYLLNDDPWQGHAGTSVFVDVLVGVLDADCGSLDPAARCRAEIIPDTAFAWSFDADRVIRSQLITLEQFLSVSGNTPRSLAAIGLRVAPTDADRLTPAEVAAAAGTGPARAAGRPAAR